MEGKGRRGEEQRERERERERDRRERQKGRCGERMEQGRSCLFRGEMEKGRNSGWKLKIREGVGVACLLKEQDRSLGVFLFERVHIMERGCVP